MAHEIRHQQLFRYFFMRRYVHFSVSFQLVGVLLLFLALLENAFGQSGELQLNDCASCHQEFWSSWRQGPHAYAAEALNVFRGEVLRNPELHGTLKVLQAQKSEDRQCQRCHAPQNLFEHFFTVPGAPGVDKHWTELPEPRDKSTQTGVDCLSCHKSFGRVVSKAENASGTTSVEPTPRCKPIPVSALGAKEFCFTCHAGPASEWLKTRPFLSSESRQKFGDLGCYGCHADTVHRSRPLQGSSWHQYKIEKYRKIFGELKLSYEKVGQDEYLLLQAPTLAPHSIPSQSVHEFLFTVPSSNGFIVIARLNIKKAEDARFAKEFPGQEPPGGVIGDSMDVSGKGLATRFRFNVAEKIGRPKKVTVKYKSQYWLPDTQAVDLATITDVK